MISREVWFFFLFVGGVIESELFSASARSDSSNDTFVFPLVSQSSVPDTPSVQTSPMISEILN